MPDAYIGEIKMFGGTFAPNGWAFCDGQLLEIQAYDALYAVLGTNYGGNGRTTFALPDLRGRVPMHAGQGGGLSNKQLGQQGGREEVTLTEAQMPSHSHAVAKGNLNIPASTAPSNETEPDPEFTLGSSVNIYTDSIANTTIIGPKIDITLKSSGGGTAHSVMQPYTTINFIIALEGVFPPRS